MEEVCVSYSIVQERLIGIDSTEQSVASCSPSGALFKTWVSLLLKSSASRRSRVTIPSINSNDLVPQMFVVFVPL